MKILVKKTYCGTCQRLVTGREQKANNVTRIACSRCGRVLWAGDGITWRSVREAA